MALGASGDSIRTFSAKAGEAQASVKASASVNLRIVVPQKEEVITFLPCGCFQIFHDPCIKEWLKKSLTCPSCRQEVVDVDEFNY